MMNLLEEKIVCFDGVCGICNGYIDFLIKRDKQRVLRYAPLQNDKIKRKLELVINPNETELIKIIADTNIINF